MKNKLQQWVDNGWLQPQSSSREEIEKLLETVERDFNDVKAPVSVDNKFIIIYRALIALCTVLARSSGYRVERDNHHYRSIQILRLILGDKYSLREKYFQNCRKKRHELTYEMVGTVTGANVEELVKALRELQKDVIVWLEDNHPDLISP